MRSSNPKGGGVWEAVRQLSHAQVQAGHEITIITLDDPASPYESSGLRLIKAGVGLSHKYGYHPKFKAVLAELVAQHDSFVVHGLWQYHGYAARQVLRSARQPYVIYPHGMLDPWFKRNYPFKHLKKLFYWFWGEYPVLRDAAQVIFTSEEERKASRNSFRPYKVNEVIIPLGLKCPNLDPINTRNRFFTDHPETVGKKLLLFLGRLHEKKGCDLLLHAFARNCRGTDWTLLMVGPGLEDYSQKLRVLAVSLGIEKQILWLGMLMGEPKWATFHAADAFILPSHQENFAIAVVEALSCGVPVLISNKVNIWREIQDGGAGFVEEDTLEGTERLIQAWQQADVPTRETLKQKARSLYLERFQVETAAASLVNLLTGNMARNSSKNRVR
ncbi:MAG: glycosyltransferase [Verrucomicrobiota bacterium]|nr:glycosyltransferase [Verrucomicrobiota bacterium]